MVPVPPVAAYEHAVIDLVVGSAVARSAAHTDRVPRTYHADHTAHIRDRLTSRAVYFLTGLLISGIAAITTAVLPTALAAEPPPVMATAVRGIILILAGMSGLGLALTGVQYRIYLRRRADLDAAGAEAIGEMNARLHRHSDGTLP